MHRREQFEFVPGIFDLARYAAGLGWPVVVVTNQAGIGRGYFDEAAFQDLTRWMCERFAAERAPIAGVYHCPYHPEFGLGALPARPSLAQAPAGHDPAGRRRSRPRPAALRR